MNESPLTTTKFVTDTATIAVFDPTSLRHRCGDSCDWWSVPAAEIDEVQKGHMFSVDLGADGNYKCVIFRDGDDSLVRGMQVVAIIETRMGSVYVGAGEEIPGGGLGPETVFGGVMVSLPAGSWKAGLSRRGPWDLELRFAPTSETPHNSIQDPLRLP